MTSDKTVVAAWSALTFVVTLGIAGAVRFFETDKSNVERITRIESVASNNVESIRSLTDGISTLANTTALVQVNARDIAMLTTQVRELTATTIRLAALMERGKDQR